MDDVDDGSGDLLLRTRFVTVTRCVGAVFLGRFFLVTSTGVELLAELLELSSVEMGDDVVGCALGSALGVVIGGGEGLTTTTASSFSPVGLAGVEGTLLFKWAFFNAC